MDGYDFVHMDRKHGAGGGVALFVDTNLRFSVVEDMSLSVENIFECLTIELHREHRKNVILSCIYRKPGSCVERFSEYMEEMYTKKASKTIIVCGDFNIDMLNPNKHNLTENFISTIYSLNLYPKITRPTRITTHSATLIDNILTNEIFNDAISGILISDISDHLPVFTVFDSDCKPHQEPLSKFKRSRSEESLNVFKNDLFVQNWDGVYDKSNVHDAYDEFMRIFKQLYDKNCPLKKICTISNKKGHPWITKGLKNAIKKKNLLYKEFFKQRTKEAENKYKKYKNKLTNILRKTKKDYYNKLIETKKSDVREMWKILNKVIKKIFWPVKLS